MSGATAATYVALAAVAVGTGVSVYSQQQAGKQQQEAANEQAKIAIDQAASEADARKAQAANIRKLGKAQRGEAKASLAASGVKLGEGTALELDKSIIQGSEEDALSAILSGNRIVDAAGRQADSLIKKGNLARSNANLKSASTVLTSAGTAASGWIKSSNSKTTAKEEG